MLHCQWRLCGIPVTYFVMNMPEALQQTTNAWQIVTHLGSASLLIPTVIITVAGLWQCQQKAAVGLWLLALTLAILICLATKIAFIGWGLGIASLNFTGISGHTLFATAVLPVLFHWLITWRPLRFRFAGAGLGLLLAVAVGVSRVVLGAHSQSEVVSGWLVGLVVSGVAVHALHERLKPPRFALMALAVLMFVFDTTTATYLPTHYYETRLALFLSRHDKPYTRHELMRPAT